MKVVCQTNSECSANTNVFTVPISKHINNADLSANMHLENCIHTMQNILKEEHPVNLNYQSQEVSVANRANVL